jgi:ankyrin repeat protein
VLLLDAEADITARTSLGQTALGLAAMYEHDITIKVLLYGHASVVTKDGNSQTSLQLAA